MEWDVLVEEDGGVGYSRGNEVSSSIFHSQTIFKLTVRVVPFADLIIFLKNSPRICSRWLAKVP